MEKCYTHQAKIYAAVAPRSDNLLMAGLHSVFTSCAQVEDLNSTHESHTTIVNGDEITSDLEVSAGALTSGDGNDGHHARNVVARRRWKNVPYTSQQKISK